MQGIADRGNIEESALVQYIIDGIQDEEVNKSVLYNSRTLEELKRNLDVYDRMCQRTQEKKSFTPQGEVTKRRKEVDKPPHRLSSKKLVHCFNCGSIEHELKDCPFETKGPKCFRCNGFGHIASACIKSPMEDRPNESVRRVKALEDKTIPVTIANVKCLALIDTGSEANLIREDVYKKVGITSLEETTRAFSGLGGMVTRPLGKWCRSLLSMVSLMKRKCTWYPKGLCRMR